MWVRAKLDNADSTLRCLPSIGATYTLFNAQALDIS